MFPFGKSKPETPLSALEALKKAQYSLASLPETIRIPATPERGETDTKPINEATIDDIAFALRGLEAASSALIDQMYALRKLSQIARDAGALGAHRAVEAAARRPLSGVERRVRLSMMAALGCSDRPGAKRRMARRSSTSASKQPALSQRRACW